MEKELNNKLFLLLLLVSFASNMFAQVSGGEISFSPNKQRSQRVYSSKKDHQSVNANRKKVNDKAVVQELTFEELWEKIKKIENNSKELSDFIELQKKAAIQGNAIAQYNLGRIYYLGIGVKKDETEAAKWFRKASEQGYARAQYWLGHMCHFGEGVTKDYSEAVKWYRRAAGQGDAYAKGTLKELEKLGYK